MDTNQPRCGPGVPGFRDETRQRARCGGPGEPDRLDGIRDLFTLEGAIPANR